MLESCSAKLGNVIEDRELKSQDRMIVPSQMSGARRPERVE